MITTEESGLTVTNWKDISATGSDNPVTEVAAMLMANILVDGGDIPRWYPHLIVPLAEQCVERLREVLPEDTTVGAALDEIPRPWRFLSKSRDSRPGIEAAYEHVFDLGFIGLYAMARAEQEVAE